MRRGKTSFRGFDPSTPKTSQVGLARAPSSNFGGTLPLFFKIAVVGVVCAFFVLVAFGARGFFADEFQYIDAAGLGQEGLAARLLTIRPPFVPVVLKALAPLGLVYQHDGGLWAFRFLVWGAGLLGAFLLGKELADGEELLGWLFVLVLGTAYVWVFYSAKILTDALVVTEAVWLFFFIQKGVNSGQDLWGCADLWYAAAFLALCVGLVTKPTFLAFVPLSALFILMPRSVSLLAVSAGFAFLAGAAGVTEKMPGSDRYLLPVFVFFLLGGLVFVFSKIKPAWVLQGVILWFVGFGIVQLFVFGPVDLPKFGEMRALSRLNGVVVANLPDYAEFYCPSCNVVDWRGADLAKADWVALQRKDERVVAEVDARVAELARDGRFSLFYNQSGLTIFKRLTVVK